MYKLDLDLSNEVINGLWPRLYLLDLDPDLMLDVLISILIHVYTLAASPRSSCRKSVCGRLPPPLSECTLFVSIQSHPK